MSGVHPESVELFLQEASEHLQYLREYSGQLQEPQTSREDLEKLYIAAHTLDGTSASYGFPMFSEIAARAAHVFHYAMNAVLTPEMYGPLTEFISDAIAVLEFDLLQMGTTGVETGEDIAAFKQRYAFAFPAPQVPEPVEEAAAPSATGWAADPVPEAAAVPSLARYLPQDGEVPDDVLGFFIPEAEEHLQSVTECLLALEANPNPEDIHRLFRAMHTVKGSAAQVGLHRLSAVAHRVEDLIGHLRDGILQPSSEIIDICLESVDVLKKFLHRQWTNDGEMAAAVDPLLARIGYLAPEEPAGGTAADQSAGDSGDAASLSESAGSALGQSAAPTGQRAGQALPQAKSVRISLDRLDRMMNAVGELVINRTRMLGRLSELKKLVEVLNFSKARLGGKVAEFQEKHEFSRLRTSLVPGSQLPQMDTFGGHTTLAGIGTASDLLEFSELEMDRYDDFNILSRSLTEISADVTEVLTQLEGFMGRVDS